MISNSALRMVAAYGAVACIGTGLYFNYKIQARFWQTDYYKNSMKILRSTKAAIDLLGEPIRDGRLDLGDDYNRVDGLNARLVVPLKGSKQKGKLYLFASRNQYSDAYLVDRLELQLNDDDSKRLLLYNNEK